MCGHVIAPIDSYDNNFKGRFFHSGPGTHTMKQNVLVYNYKMAYLISNPSSSSKPVILLHCCELPSVTEVSQAKKCTLNDMYEPVINRDLSTFPSSQIWDVLPANPDLVSTSRQTQGYSPAPSPPAGSAPQLTRLYISNSALFSVTKQKLLQTCG